jgi:uroporphyrinogen decarboxylase
MLRPLTSVDTFLSALNGKAASPPPIWLMRQAGRYLPEYREIRAKVGSFLDLCLNPELAAEVTLQPIRRFGFDAAIVFSDILIIPYALGQNVEFVEGEGPRLEPIDNTQALNRLDAQPAETKLAPVYETIDRVVIALEGKVPLIGFCGAPYTVATYMVGGGTSKDQAETRLWAYHRPQEFGWLINLLVETSARYLLGQVKAGASALQIFDSWAGSLPEDQFAHWCIAPTKALVERVRTEAPDIPIIGFPRGSGPLSRRYAEETGIDAIGCDQGLPLDWIKANLQDLVTVQGNLDPVLLVAGGRRLDERVGEILEALSPHPFVFNLGHGILPETPIAHVERLVSLVRGG